MGLIGTVDGRHGRYDVGDVVMENDRYRLRFGRETVSGRECYLQVAVDAARNGAVDRMAYFLRALKARSGELEEAYAAVKKDPDSVLNYDIGFPELLDAFALPDGDGRKANVLAFRNVARVVQMVPLERFEREGNRIDIRSSAWVFGKWLKLLAFAHDQGLLVGRVDGSNLLLEPKEHYALVFDWSDARTHAGPVPAEDARAEIQAAAKAVIAALGGDHARRFVPREGNEDPGFSGYVDCLFQFASGRSASAEEAHATFYAYIRQELSWRGFHPFTTHPIN